MPTLSSDVYTNTVVVAFTLPNQTWIVAAGVIAASDGNNPVYSTLARSHLINRGYILSSDYTGVYFNGSDGVVDNTRTGTIVGYNGLYFDGTDIDLVNRGTIVGIGSSGVNYGTTSSDVTLRNFGKISGEDFGIYGQGDLDSALIENRGIIHGGDWGIDLDTANGLNTVIRNFAGGVIRGDDAGIGTQNEGRFTLTNLGRLVNGIDSQANSGNTNDVVINRGVITGETKLGAGVDFFNGTQGIAGKVLGGAEGDTLLAGRGGNWLDGGDGGDVIKGGVGNDRLEAGNQGDFPEGGPGADDIYLNLFSAPNTPDGWIDFVQFRKLSHSGVTPATRDEIFGFDPGPGIRDIIDVSAIDANGTAPGNGKFKIVTAFTAARGEIRLVIQGGNTLVQLDGDNDTAVDATILVHAVGLSDLNFDL